MAPYLFFAALFGGLLMFLLCKENSKAIRIGELLFFAAVLALLIAIAPSTVHVLHAG